MTKRDGDASREERLAARLRENLLRRKAQARARRLGAPAGEEDPPRLPNREEDG